MKLFEKRWKTNFVDENNVFVGFDNEQNCCENFGYMVTRTPPVKIEEFVEDILLDDYNFDPDFIQESVLPEGDLDAGGSVMFKLVNRKNKSDIAYLTLYNEQNGYYSHGFEFGNGAVIVKEGLL